MNTVAANELMASGVGAKSSQAADLPMRRSTVFAYTFMVWPLTIAQLSLGFVAPFYAMSFGMSLAFVGFVLTLGRLIDVVADAAVAWASDRTRTRWGRRKPWVVCGMLIYFPSTILLFVPVGYVTGPRFIVTMLLFFISWTMAFIPYLSQGTELSSDYHVKNRINLMQSAIMLAALISAFVVPLLLYDPRAALLRHELGNALGNSLPWLVAFLNQPSPKGASYYGHAMLVITILSLTPMLFSLPIYMLKLREPKLAANIEKGSFIAAFKNPVFMRFAIGYVFMMIAHLGRGGLLPFILIFVLRLPDSYLFFMMLLFTSSLVVTPVWARLLRRFERVNCLIMAAAVEALGMVLLFFTPAHNVPMTALDFILIGLPGQTLLMVPYLIAADCSDYSQWKTGTNTRAIHLSLCSLIAKLGTTFAGISVWLVGLAGFVPTRAVQTPFTLHVLKDVGLGVPILCLLVGSLIIWRFPLDRRRHAAVRNRLNVRAE